MCLQMAVLWWSMLRSESCETLHLIRGPFPTPAPIISGLAVGFGQLDLNQSLYETTLGA